MKKGIVGGLVLFFVFLLISNVGILQAEWTNPMPRSPLTEVAENIPPEPLSSKFEVVEIKTTDPQDGQKNLG